MFWQIYFFLDIDDTWKKDKLEKQLKSIYQQIMI